MLRLKNQSELNSLLNGEKVKKAHKYGAIRTIYNGKEYPSKREANYAAYLDLQVKAGIVAYYLEQIFLRYKGGGKLIIDFLVFYTDGRVEYIDAKGKRTALYLAKKRIVEATWPIKIREV
jgi:hypothetical protein